MCRSQTAQRRGERPEQWGYSERLHLYSTLARRNDHNPSGNGDSGAVCVERGPKAAGVIPLFPWLPFVALRGNRLRERPCCGCGASHEGAALEKILEPIRPHVGTEARPLVQDNAVVVRDKRVKNNPACKRGSWTAKDISKWFPRGDGTTWGKDAIAAIAGALAEAVA